MGKGASRSMKEGRKCKDMCWDSEKKRREDKERRVKKRTKKRVGGGGRLEKRVESREKQENREVRTKFK